MPIFYTSFLTSAPFFHATARVTSLDYLEPVTRAAVMAILKDSVAAGTPLIVFETYRSAERQKFLFDRGASQLRDVGVHHYGLAADLVKDVNGRPSWDGDWRFLRDLAAKHGLVSGYDWGEPSHQHAFVDACHVQRIAVSDQVKLFSGAWYPDTDYAAVTAEPAIA